MSEKTPAVVELTSPTDEKWWGEKMPAKYSEAGDVGSVGPHLGSYALRVIRSGFLLQVSLPGVRGAGNLRFNVEEDGTVQISGLTAIRPPPIMGQFEKLTDNFYPDRPFSITIRIPEPIDPKKVKVLGLRFGILEVAIGRKGRR